MASEELTAAREHWEQCDHAREQAVRAEVDAFHRLQIARADFERFLPVVPKGPEASQDAPGTPPRTAGVSDAEDRSACDCEETCAECGKAVTEDEYADTPRGEPVLHDACRPAHAAWRREQEAAWRADDVMFSDGRGSL